MFEIEYCLPFVFFVSSCLNPAFAFGSGLNEFKGFDGG